MVSLIRASNILLLPYTAQVSSIHTALHGFKAILRNNHGNHHFAVYQNNRCIQGHPFMDNKEENAKCLTCSHLFKTLTLFPSVILRPLDASLNGSPDIYAATHREVDKYLDAIALNVTLYGPFEDEVPQNPNRGTLFSDALGEILRMRLPKY